MQYIRKFFLIALFLLTSVLSTNLYAAAVIAAVPVEHSNMPAQSQSYWVMQSAMSGELKLNQHDGNYKLVLNSVDPWITYFVSSKDGNRISGMMSTDDYYKNKENHLYQQNVHSVLLTFKNPEHKKLKLEVILSQPEYNAKTHQLTFIVIPVTNENKHYILTTSNLATTLGHVVILSDNGDICGKDCLDWP